MMTNTEATESLKPDTEPQPTPRKAAPGYGWLVLAAVACVLVTFVRLHTFREALEADEAIYSVIANDWLQGGRPYETLWDNKPIGTFFIYRIAIACFGYTEIAPRVASLVAVLLSTILLVVLLRVQNRSLQTAVPLMALWVLTNGLISCHANGANMEIFICPFILAALWGCHRFQMDPRPWHQWLGYGMLATSMLVKQVTLPFLILPFLYAPLAKLKQFRYWLLHGVIASAALIVLHILVYAIFGYAPATIVAQFQRNSHHVTTEVGNTVSQFATALLAIPLDQAVRPVSHLIIAAMIAIGWHIIRRGWLQSNANVVIGFVVAAMLAIALPGSNMPHYYLLLLPLVILGLGYWEELIPRRAAVLALTVCTVLLGVHVYRSYWCVHPDKISYVKYGNSSWFVLDRMIGRTLKERGITQTRIYVDGSHPGVYFYSDNRPALKYFMAWNYTSMDVTTWTDEFRKLRENPPAVCALSNPMTSQTQAVREFASWLEQNYNYVEEIYGTRIWVRRAAGLKQ